MNLHNPKGIPPSLYSFIPLSPLAVQGWGRVREPADEPASGFLLKVGEKGPLDIDASYAYAGFA